MTARVWAISAMLAASAACGPPHIAPFTPRHRILQQGEYAVARADAKPAPGSVFSEAVPGLLQDARALRAGDIVFIRIDEKANASGDASTKLDRESGREVGVNALFGLVPAMKKSHPDIDPEELIALLAKSDFNGQGKTTRQGELRGNIAVRVRETMPNGDLFVEGTKVVMINHEENHLYISGLVRMTDIGPDNSVPSTRIAEAQVEFTGRGAVADQVERGWLTKFFDAINPF